MVDVEVDNGNPFQPVFFEGVRGSDCDIVEQAETHCARPPRMVSRRTNAAKRAPHLALHHQIRRADGGASRPQGGIERVPVHRGVGIEMHDAARGRSSGDRIDVMRRVNALEMLALRFWRILPSQMIEQAGSDQLVVHRTQPVRALGMASAHLVQ